MLLLVTGCITESGSAVKVQLERIAFKEGQKSLYSYELRSVRDSIVGITSRQEIVLSTLSTDSQQEGLSGAIHQVSYPANDTLEQTHTWYRQDEETLLEVAYANPAAVSNIRLKHARSIHRQRKQLLHSSMVPTHLMPLFAATSDGKTGMNITFREPPRTVLAYPLIPEVEWVSFTISGRLRADRFVRGYRTIDTSDGPVETVWIETILSRESEVRFSIDEYIDRYGLVLRSFTVPVDVGEVTTTVRREELNYTGPGP